MFSIGPARVRDAFVAGRLGPTFIEQMEEFTGVTAASTFGRAWTEVGHSGIQQSVREVVWNHADLVPGHERRVREHGLSLAPESLPRHR